MRRPISSNRFAAGYGASSSYASREADLFLADLIGRPVQSPWRTRGRSAWPTEMEDAELDEGYAGMGEQLVEVCGFFGPNNVRRTEQQIRDAIVARANQEWAAWHTAAVVPRPESEVAMFGRLLGYYLAASSAGAILPDTLTSMLAAALGTINYAPLLAVAATPQTIASEAARIRGLLLAGAPGATASNLNTRVEEAIRQARQAHLNAGDFAAWSAAFVTGCVRGTSITQGLEAVIPPGRRHIGRNELLLASLTHAAYTIAARDRRAASNPRRRGTYHAFRPDERAPQLSDIVVMDRRPNIPAAQITTLAGLTQGIITHGDIVVEVQPTFVVTVGGNLGGNVVGGSSRRRRFPRDAQGLLVVDTRQGFASENDQGILPAVPARSAQPLASLGTRRIFALLSVVEECAAVPGQPYGGGVLT
jgi:hypothetical protein